MILRILLGAWLASFVLVIWLLLTAPRRCAGCEGPVDEAGNCLTSVSETEMDELVETLS